MMDSPFKVNENMEDHLQTDKYYKKDPKDALFNISDYRNKFLPNCPNQESKISPPQKKKDKSKSPDLKKS